ncbi:hypothetical protein IWW50_000299 [Coemansia erecta]|nr:hypothetical protein GGF43_000528 [Coemansia sp. RSA 2618]KAJ2830410.1 hypothetical protein IWW50_000299 [Coemansia erecta]
MSRGGRGRGRGGARREMTGLQTELMGKNLFSDKPSEPPGLFPTYDVFAGRDATDEEKYVSALMNAYKMDMRASVFYLQAPPPPRDIERYSDRFAKGTKHESLKDIQTDIALFPEELQSTVSRRKIKRTKVAADADDVLKLLDKVRDESGDEEDEEGEKKKKDGENSEDDEERLAEDEEEEEEENDYMATYFDNGEDDDLGDGDDDEGGGDYY